MFIIKLKLKFMLIYVFALCHRKTFATATLRWGERWCCFVANDVFWKFRNCNFINELFIDLSLT